VITLGRTERRVVFAILVTAILPLLASMGLAGTIIRRVASTAFQPEFGQQLERSLGVYAELVKSMKRGMRAEAKALLAEHRTQWLRDREDSEKIGQSFDQLLQSPSSIHALALRDDEGLSRIQRARTPMLDEKRYRPFVVSLPLRARPAEGEDDGLQFVVVFAAERTRLDEMESAQRFTQVYRRLERDQRTIYLDRPYLIVFALLLGATVLLATISGILVVGPVNRRIKQLAEATRPVAGGDLSVRVEADGQDELSALARAFNHMLEALERSRARIEFLQRLGQWQTMARRLAHEIKNPLTPIQLAVEECHQRYDGGNEAFSGLLNTTREIVVEEVASLRRLVTEFSNFARLPQADLVIADLADFIRDQRTRLDAEALPDGVAMSVKLEEGPMPLALDRTMLHRALVNLVANAAQAALANGGGAVRVDVRRDGDTYVVDVEDDGAGVADDMKTAVFEPYVTSKTDGTGLGLTIVKKIILDHGGAIAVCASAQLGGACFRIRLPISGSDASEVALTQSVVASVRP
jgi:two-component system nitrogen regulation sensor histidine kinase NtrY